MKYKKVNKYLLFGLSALVVGFWILVSTYSLLVKNEVVYQATQNQLYIPKEIIPVNKDFGIVIPKIGANSKIIRDVDPNNSAIYQKALTQGVAHAKGTRLPGQKGNIFLFSHSSSDFFNAHRYNSIFYLLSKLETSDEVKIYFNQQEFKYSVISKKIISPNDLSYQNSNSSQEILTLMTCWPPGTSLKRLVIQAKRTPKEE